jgi:hypothetical protein
MDMSEAKYLYFGQDEYQRRIIKEPDRDIYRLQCRDKNGAVEIVFDTAQLQTLEQDILSILFDKVDSST